MKLGSAIVALGLTAVLGACGSSNAVSDEITVDRAFTLLDRANGESLPAAVNIFTPTATMSGYGGVVTSEDDFFGGNMSMIANFDESTISGSATNIASYELTGCDSFVIVGDCSGELTERLGGSLALVGDITDSSFAGFLDGDLNGTWEEEGESGTYIARVELSVNGDFREDSKGLFARAVLEGDAGIFLDGDDTSSDGFGLEGIFVVAE